MWPPKPKLLEIVGPGSHGRGTPITRSIGGSSGSTAVVTAVGGMPSVVRDGVEGRLVAPGSPSALAEALVAMADPALRHRCGAAAKERAAEFAADRAVNRQEDLYEELVGRVGR